MTDKIWQWLPSRRFVVLPLLLSVLSVIPPGVGDSVSASTYDTVLVTVKSETGLRRGTIRAKVANTPQKRYVGLRGVTELDTNAGMLFLYSGSRERTFTMVDVKIPLDIIFVDRTGRILTIHTAKPGEEAIRSGRPARYVLETNAGWARKRGVRIGDIIQTKN